MGREGHCTGKGTRNRNKSKERTSNVLRLVGSNINNILRLVGSNINDILRRVGSNINSERMLC